MAFPITRKVCFHFTEHLHLNRPAICCIMCDSTPRFIKFLYTTILAVLGASLEVYGVAQRSNPMNGAGIRSCSNTQTHTHTHTHPGALQCPQLGIFQVACLCIFTSYWIASATETIWIAQLFPEEFCCETSCETEEPLRESAKSALVIVL